MNLDEFFREEEAKAIDRARKEIAAEKAAYDALPQEEKDRLRELAEAKWAAFDDACKASEAAAEDEDEDEDEDTEDEEDTDNEEE